MNKSELGEFLSHFYQTRSVDRAPEALECSIRSDILREEHARDLSCYAFSRIGELFPEVVRGYETLFSRSKRDRPFILQILQRTRDAHTKEFLQQCLESKKFRGEDDLISDALNNWSLAGLNALEWPIRQPGDLDFLWAEFCITGNTKAIVKIIEVLGWPDRVREKLQDWLASTPRIKFLSKTRRERFANRLFEMGILLDADVKDILSTQDLDCFCTMDGGNISRERLDIFKTLFPFPLSQEDLNHIGIKTAAKWSLGANTLQHPIALEICNSEAASRVGSCRLTLLEIAAYTNLASNDLGTALTRIHDSLTPNPPERSAQLENAEAQFQALLNLSVGELARGPVSDISPAEICTSCTEMAVKVRTYRSQSFLQEVDKKTAPGNAITWRLEYVKPDKFHVSQTAGQDYDEWVTLGYEHFRSPGFASITALRQSDSRINRFLLVDKYIEIMRETQPDSVALYQSGERHYCVLDYRSVAPLRFLHFFVEDPEPKKMSLSQALVWVDLRTFYVVKADLVLMYISDGGSSPELSRFVQLFVSHDEDIQIVPPAFQLIGETERTG